MLLCMIFIWSHIYYSHITNSVTFVLDIMLGAVKTRHMSQNSPCTQDAYISKTKEQIQPQKGTRVFFFSLKYMESLENHSEPFKEKRTMSTQTSHLSIVVCGINIKILFIVSVVHIFNFQKASIFSS